MAQNIRNILLTASFTRPANTTQYTAEDAVNDNTSTPHIMTFTSTEITLQAGQDLIIKSVRMVTDNNSTTNASFRLRLRKSTQSIAADNTPQPLTWSNRTNRYGYIDFTLGTGGTGSDCAEAFVTDVNMPIRLTEGAIYGFLVAKAAYTPTSGQNFYFEIEAHVING